MRHDRQFLEHASDAQIIAEYKARELDENGGTRDDALRALRHGRLDECLYQIAKLLGRDFDALPGALDRYTATILKDDGHARQAA